MLISWSERISLVEGREISLVALHLMLRGFLLFGEKKNCLRSGFKTKFINVNDFDIFVDREKFLEDFFYW